MDWKVFLTIFGAVFIAELGDKTQLATMLFATDKEVSKYTVFFAASAALIVASALGVLAGTFCRNTSMKSIFTMSQTLGSSALVCLHCIMRKTHNKMLLALRSARLGPAYVWPKARC